jgi:hypothetical protein
MIIYTNQKSKKSKKQRAKQQELLKEQRAIKRSLNYDSGLITKPAYRRETEHYPSLPFSGGPCTKPIEGKVYTGTAMKGIGTLHKSNAVPIFTDEEARDQASMRR